MASRGGLAADHVRARSPITSTQKLILVVVGVAAFTIAAFLTGLDADLPNTDDSMFAWAVRDSARRGAWLDYEWFGVPFQRWYPPLGYALASLPVRALGATETALRLVPALAAAGAALCGFALVRRLGGALWAAAFAALSLVALSVFYYFGHTAGVDPVMTLCLMLTQLGIVAALDQPRRWPWVGVAAGLAILSKGPAAALPLVGMLGALALARPRPTARQLGVAAGVAALVALPWHLYQLARYGGGFVADYLGFNVVARMTGHIAGADTSFDFYLTSLIRLDPILGTVVLVGAAAAIAAWLRPREARLAGLIGAAVVPLVVFSASETRLLKYLMPSLAPLAVLAALAAHRWLGRFRVAPALVALPLVMFFVHTVPTTAGSTLPPGQRELAEQARGLLAPDETLYVFDDYHVSTAYYADRPTRLVTLDDRAFYALDAVPLLHASGTVLRTNEDDVRAYLAGERARVVLIEARFLPRIAWALRELGLDQAATAGDYTLVWAAR